MTAPFKRTVVWSDAAGQTSLRTLTSLAGAPLTMAALLAKSNAVINEWWESVDTLGTATPLAAAVPFASQVAYLQFQDGAGHQARIALPAPLGSMCLTDQVTVDPTQIAAIIAAAQIEVVTTAGTLVTTFTGGQLGKGQVNQ